MNLGDYKSCLKQACRNSAYNVVLAGGRISSAVVLHLQGQAKPGIYSLDVYIIFHSSTCSSGHLSLKFPLLQINFSTKSSSKDLAALINKYLKAQDDISKDEL